MSTIKIIVALLSSLFLAGGFVFAFVLFDPPVKWLASDLPRNIQINQNGHSAVADGDGGITEIVDAIANSWNAAVPDPMPGPSNGVTSTSLVSSPPISIGDGISTMHFNVVGTGCSGSCLAVTFTPIATSGSEVVNGVTFGGITDSDIFFNTSGKFYSSSEPDGCNREAHIESVAVHEVGHLLGLLHTPVSNATMFATTSLCSNNGESLAQDDLDGISCIYKDGAGCGGCVSDTLVVNETNCSQPSSGPNSGDFLVETFIVDNCGTAVVDADVTIDIPISPLGPLSCSGQTSASGRLGCALDNPPDGLYESLVGDVSKTGFPMWDASECGGIGVPPCGCSIQIGDAVCGDGVCGGGEDTVCPDDCTDTDLDGVADSVDNCPLTSNPDQGASILFDQSVIASDKSTFSWAAAADVVWARGDLTGVSTYSILETASASAATSVGSVPTPAVGDGWYFVVRPDCPMGSWTSGGAGECASAGSCPAGGRDGVLP
jgi:hypothetical protein